MNFSAFLPCFFDHLFFVSDFRQQPCRNFLRFSHYFSTAAFASGIFIAWSIEKTYVLNEFIPSAAMWSSRYLCVTLSHRILTNLSASTTQAHLIFFFDLVFPNIAAVPCGSSLRQSAVKQRLNLNFNAVSSVLIAHFYVRDWSKSYIVLDHPLKRVPSWSRGNIHSRHKDWFSLPCGDGRAWKNCPTSINLKLTSERCLDNFWSFSTKVAARQCAPSQPGRSIGRSSESGRQVASALAAPGETEFCSAEGCRTCSKRTPSGHSSRGVPGVYQTFTEPFGAVGGGMSQGTAGIGRCDGSHGEVSRTDVPVDPSCTSTSHLQCHTTSQHHRLGVGDREVEVTGGGDGGRTRGGTQESFAISVYPLPRPHRRVGSDIARVGRFTRSARWTAQRGDHGNSDQSREHSRLEFQSFSPRAWRKLQQHKYKSHSTGSGTVWVQRTTCRRGIPPGSTNVHVQTVVSS